MSSSTKNPETSEIVSEFTYMLEKSHQLFNQLRDLSPLSTNKQWQSYFQKTFELFSRLWRFQQLHRQVLNDEYQLRRYEVGEIASKIAQLYYHYYLRTSDTTYLYESKVFYDAIRERKYFNNLFELKNPTLIVKKLRYYCRYCIVCLLCNHLELTKELYEELQQLIDQYSTTFQADDTKEWQLVLQEIIAFSKCLENSGLKNIKSVSMRLSTANPPSSGLTLSESVIIGGLSNQIKCSELTVDMYRILQLLEVNKSNSSATQAANPLFPKKYLLYKPSFSNLSTYLSGAYKQAQSCLFIYISCESFFQKVESKNDLLAQFQVGLNCIESSAVASKSIDSLALYSIDLLPYTRKPLLLMLDCPSNRQFKLPNLYQMPLLVLLSPSILPDKFQDYSKCGNLYTLFIYSPVLGFLHISDCLDISTELHEKVKNKMDELKQYITLTVTSYTSDSEEISNNILAFLSDDYLRNLIVNHLTAIHIMSVHSAFENIDVFYTNIVFT